MSFGRTRSAVIVGVNAQLVEVEAHLASGLPGLSLVGLPDTAMAEARVRVRAAIVNSGLRWPDLRITVGLSPAWLPKRGPGLDVAIALAVLAADGQVPREDIERALVIGELGLNGRIKPVAGSLAAALAFRAANRGHARTAVMMTGRLDASQAELVPDVEVIAAPSLRALVARLRGEQEPDEDMGTSDDDAFDTRPGRHGALMASPIQPAPDLVDVKGQDLAKTALEVAAVGGHHIALFGRAGVGKTLLAQRLRGLLPELDEAHALEVTSIHQLAGVNSGLGSAGEVARRPPWFAPHHTCTRAAMVGGGSADKPTIGAVSLSHRGVLFLDEAAEFEPSVLDALREPLESGEVCIARAGFRLSLPARFQLVIASNPCPCGNALDSHRGALCRCTPTQRRKYLGRLSGPLLDRFDIRLVLARPTLAELNGLSGTSETSDVVAARVERGRVKAAARLAGSPWSSIADVPAEQLRTQWPLPVNAARLIDAVGVRQSARGRDRTIRLAWSLADLSDHELPTTSDVDKAIELRSQEQEWAA